MYEIYAYGNNASLNGIFNAVAAIMGGADYMDLIRVIGLIGPVARLNVNDLLDLGDSLRIQRKFRHALPSWRDPAWMRYLQRARLKPGACSTRQRRFPS